MSVVGIAGVDHQRQAAVIARRRDVAQETLALRVARGVVVVVVEPGLADGDDDRVVGDARRDRRR